MTSDIPNKEELRYFETKEYQDKMFEYISEAQQTFKKDMMKEIKKARNSTNIAYANYNIETIRLWLRSPLINEARLRLLSNFLYDTNALYKWFINTMAGMPTFAWTLSMDTYGSRKSPEKLEKVYRQGLKYLDGKNIPYEMGKAILHCFKNDFFYGYEIEENGYYSILNLNPDFTRINRKAGDGVYGIQFNFTFFDSQYAWGERDNLIPIINSYPDEFRMKYLQYQQTGEMWQDLDVNNTIVLKLNEDIEYGLPFFASILEDLSDIGFFKDLNKERAEIDNFMLLHQHIPVDEKEFNKFAIDLTLAKTFNEVANSILPEGVSMFTSPMKIEAVKTERSLNDNQNVKGATSQTFTGAGLPQQLSSTDNNTASGLAKAIIANEQIIFRFLRQVEKVYNYKLKNKFTGTEFQFGLLKITNFNKDLEADKLLKGAQNGIVPPSHVASALGSNPYRFMNDVDLEYNILGLTHKLQPLQTSHTMSTMEQEAHPNAVGAGAPTMNDADLSDSGDTARNNDTNNRDM